METCNGDDMQCNVSLGQMGVAKWGVYNSSYRDNDCEQVSIGDGRDKTCPSGRE